MHPFNDTLPGLYVPVRVTRGALVAHRYTYAPPRFRTSKKRRTSILLWNDLADLLFNGMGFQEQGQCFLIGISCSMPSLVLYYFSLSLLPLYRLVLRGWGLQTDRVYITLSHVLLLLLLLLIIIIIIRNELLFNKID